MFSSDDQLLAHLNTPPDLRDGVESLEYWRDRRKRLAWYRVRARREAKLMTQRWERRVRAALLSQHGVPLGSRVAAGLLLARVRVQRFPFRAVAATLGVIAILMMILPVLAAVALLAQIL